MGRTLRKELTGGCVCVQWLMTLSLAPDGHCFLSWLHWRVGF